MIKELFKLRHDMELLDYLKSTCHSTERGIVLRLIAGLYTCSSESMSRFILQECTIRECNATITREGVI